MFFQSNRPCSIWRTLVANTWTWRHFTWTATRDIALGTTEDGSCIASCTTNECNSSFYKTSQSFRWRHPFPVLIKTCPFTPWSLLNKQKEEVTNLGQCRKLNGIWQLPPIQHYLFLSLASPFSALLILGKLVYDSARTHWILGNIACYLLNL